MGRRSSPSCANQSRLGIIAKRGSLWVGTTGDYQPFSYYHQELDEYSGHDIDAAAMLGAALGVKVVFVHTSWPTLMQDLRDNKFDIAMSGITRTLARQKQARFSPGYFSFGKSPLIRAEDKEKFTNLATIDQPDVTIGVNAGGTNEKFVRENIHKAAVIVHPQNVEIPGMVADGRVDVMITDSPEAMHYAHANPKLCAALLDQTFTENQLGFLMQRGDQDLAGFIDRWMKAMKLQGQFHKLYQKWIK